MTNSKRKLIILSLLIPLLLSCSSQIIGTQTQPKGNITEPEQPVEAEEQRILHSIEVPKDADPGLFLYGKPTTRIAVVEFYTEITGDASVAQAIIRAADEFKVPLSLAFSLAFGESDFNPWAVNTNSSSIDRGIFQLNSETFPQLEPQDFFNPAINAYHGLRYFNWCLEMGTNDIAAIAIYNAGLSRVEFGGTPRRTLDHINNIVSYRAKLDASFITHMNQLPAIRIATAEPETPRSLHLL